MKMGKGICAAPGTASYAACVVMADLLELSGMGADAFARAVGGVTPQTLIRWCRAETAPAAVVVARLSAGLGVSMACFVSNCVDYDGLDVAAGAGRAGGLEDGDAAAVGAKVHMASGLSFSKMAAAMDGVAAGAVRKWIRKGAAPKLDTFVQLCGVYGVDMDALVAGGVDWEEVARTEPVTGRSARVPLSGVRGGLEGRLVKCYGSCAASRAEVVDVMMAGVRGGVERACGMSYAGPVPKSGLEAAVAAFRMLDRERKELVLTMLEALPRSS